MVRTAISEDLPEASGAIDAAAQMQTLLSVGTDAPTPELLWGGILPSSSQTVLRSRHLISRAVPERMSLFINAEKIKSSIGRNGCTERDPMMSSGFLCAET